MALRQRGFDSEFKALARKGAVANLSLGNETISGALLTEREVVGRDDLDTLLQSTEA